MSQAVLKELYTRQFIYSHQSRWGRYYDPIFTNQETEAKKGLWNLSKFKRPRKSQSQDSRLGNMAEECVSLTLR